MVRPLREWYLPSTGLYPPRTHHLLRYLACQSPIPGIGIHTCQTYSPTITIPIPHSSHKELSNQNSKEFKLYQQARVELSSLKKREGRRREDYSPSLKSCKLWSSNKWEAIHSIHSLPSKNPMFHEAWIWQSTDPGLDHPSAKQYK